ncbi:MAG: hypothetical protein NTX27_06365 [Verrucomicrobia bacterium]|nr:hypothetical protein [Verrucomicrobiota bacterium]
MKVILFAIYLVAGSLVLLCGWFYPAVLRWSYLAVGACVLHAVLSLTVAVRPMADAAKIAAWCLQGLNAMITAGLLLAYVLRQESGWFVAAAAMAGFASLATLIFVLLLTPDTATGR